MMNQIALIIIDVQKAFQHEEFATIVTTKEVLKLFQENNCELCRKK